jgi:hypothetical protein
MITELGREHRGRIWRAVDYSWLHYAWVDSRWRVYPIDPRRSPSVQSVPASGQVDGTVCRSTGFEEVP